MAYEGLIAEVVAKRQPSERKTWLRKFLVSNLAAAVGAGVLVIFGQVVTFHYQSKLFRAQQATMAKMQAVTAALEEASAMVTAADNLLTALTGAGFTEEDIAKYRDLFNYAVTQWSRRERNLGFQLSHYYRAEPRVGEAWNDLRDAINEYLKSAEGQDLDPNSCENQHQNVESLFQKLERRIPAELDE